MRPLADFIASCTSLTKEQYCLRHPYPMLVHSKLSGELTPSPSSRGATMEHLVIGGDDRRDDKTLSEIDSSREEESGGAGTLFNVFPMVGDDPTSPKISVGAATECDVQIGDQSISREHAHLHREGDHYFISDNNSSAGTQVNDEVLMPAERRKLKVGDRVTLGLVDLNYLPARAFYEFVRRLCAE